MPDRLLNAVGRHVAARLRLLRRKQGMTKRSACRRQSHIGNAQSAGPILFRRVKWTAQEARNALIYRSGCPCPRREALNYRVGEVQDVSDGRDFHFGFSILNVHSAPIVTFSYLDRADAAKPEG